jgi:hypothetical protein
MKIKKKKFHTFEKKVSKKFTDPSAEQIKKNRKKKKEKT